MDPQKIDINIKTTADTKGAEEAQKAVDDLANKSTAAGRVDITPTVNKEGAQTAKEKVEELIGKMRELRDGTNTAAREAQDIQMEQGQAEAVASINRKVTAQIIGMAGSLAGKAAAELRDFNRELAEINPEAARAVENIAAGFDLVAVSANGAALGAAFGGPMGAAIGAAVVPAVKLTTDAIQDAILASENLKQLEKVGENLPARMAEVKRLMEMRDEIRSWSTLTDQIRAAATELQVMSRAVAITKSAQVQIAQANLNIATATGGDVAGAEARLRTAQDAAFEAQQTEALNAAISAKTVATQQLAEAENKLLVLNRTWVTASAEDQQSLMKDMQAIEKTLDGLRSRVRSADDALFIAETQSRFDRATISREKTAQEVKTGQETTLVTLDDLINQVKEKGGGSAELQSAVAAIEKAAKDGSLSKEDLAKVELFLAQWRASLLNLGVLPDTYEKVVDAVNDLTTRMKDAEGKLQPTAPTAPTQQSNGGLPPGMAPTTDQNAIQSIKTVLDDADGKGGGAELQQVIEQLRSIIADGVLSTTEIQEIPNLMSQLNTHLSGLNVIPEALRIANGRIDDVVRQVEQLQAQAK
jgi:hypothetical protein